ncbi:MAG: broad specificity phosphatase PhoE [Planctomycetota bacterium]
MYLCTHEDRPRGEDLTTLYLVRHGEVYNPRGIIYGRLPGFGLSERGQEQLGAVAEKLRADGPPTVLYASPMQRAQESAAILNAALGLEIHTDERLIETSIGSFQGKRFEDLPKPYISEEGAHPEIEAASSMRNRLLDWVADAHARHPHATIAAVSHRDPIIVALLHWMGQDLSALPEFALEPGGIYAVEFEENSDESTTVRALG